jgi:hypothetical protein
MNLSDLSYFIQQQWDKDILPRLIDYVKIPAKSPAFDASWSAHGHLDQVIALARDWAANFSKQLAGKQVLAGLKLEVVSIAFILTCQPLKAWAPIKLFCFTATSTSNPK